MEDEPTNLLAFTWYHREDYEELLEHADDPEELHDSYDEWLVDARRALVSYKLQGFDPRRIYLKVREMREWCQSRDRPHDKHARHIFKEIKRQQFYRDDDWWRSQFDEE